MSVCKVLNLICSEMTLAGIMLIELDRLGPFFVVFTIENHNQHSQLVPRTYLWIVTDLIHMMVGLGCRSHLEYRQNSRDGNLLVRKLVSSLFIFESVEQ